jgi:hypothetical protein
LETQLDPFAAQGGKAIGTIGVHSADTPVFRDPFRVVGIGGVGFSIAFPFYKLF